MFSLILTVMMCLITLNEKKNLEKISLYIYAHSRSPRSQTHLSGPERLGLRSDFTDSVSLVVLYICNDQSLRRKPDLERLVFY